MATNRRVEVSTNVAVEIVKAGQIVHHDAAAATVIVAKGARGETVTAKIIVNTVTEDQKVVLKAAGRSAVRGDPPEIKATAPIGSPWGPLLQRLDGI